MAARPAVARPLWGRASGAEEGREVSRVQSRGRGAAEPWTRAEWTHSGRRRGGGTVQSGGGPWPQEQLPQKRPKPRHIGRPDLRVEEKEAEPGLLAEVPDRTGGEEE